MEEINTLAQEMMNMMSEKENSSVNIIGQSEPTKVSPVASILPLKKENFNKPMAFSTNALKSEPSYAPKIDCEVILYVDNREKKNQ